MFHKYECHYVLPKELRGTRISCKSVERNGLRPSTSLSHTHTHDSITSSSIPSSQDATDFFTEAASGLSGKRMSTKSAKIKRKSLNVLVDKNGNSYDLEQLQLHSSGHSGHSHSQPQQKHMLNRLLHYLPHPPHFDAYVHHHHYHSPLAGEPSYKQWKRAFLGKQREKDVPHSNHSHNSFRAHSFLSSHAHLLVPPTLVITASSSGSCSPNAESGSPLSLQHPHGPTGSAHDGRAISGSDSDGDKIPPMSHQNISSSPPTGGIAFTPPHFRDFFMKSSPHSSTAPSAEPSQVVSPVTTSPSSPQRPPDAFKHTLFETYCAAHRELHHEILHQLDLSTVRSVEYT